MNCTSSAGKQETLKWERGIVRPMRPESMISYVHQFCDNAGGKITIVPAVMPDEHNGISCQNPTQSSMCDASMRLVTAAAKPFLPFHQNAVVKRFEITYGQSPIARHLDCRPAIEKWKRFELLERQNIESKRSFNVRVHIRSQTLTYVVEKKPAEPENAFLRSTKFKTPLSKFYSNRRWTGMLCQFWRKQTRLGTGRLLNAIRVAEKNMANTKSTRPCSCTT